MTTIDTNGAVHDQAGRFATTGGSSAGYDLSAPAPVAPVGVVDGYPPAEDPQRRLDAVRADAERLLTDVGLAGWRFEWDAAVARAGQTRYRDRTISMSHDLTLLHDDAKVRDTIAHEVAHALTGPGHGHDEEWRRTAIGLGGDGKRCFDGQPKPAARWVGTCPNGHQVGRNRRTANRQYSCNACSPGRFDPESVITWTRNEDYVPPTRPQTVHRRPPRASMVGKDYRLDLPGNDELDGMSVTVVGVAQKAGYVVVEYDDGDSLYARKYRVPVARLYEDESITPP